MNEIIACPNCQKKVTVPVAFFGKLVQCPQCQHTFTAVDPSEGVQSSAPPSVSLAAPTMDSWDDLPPTSDPRRRRFEDDSGDGIGLRRPMMPHRGAAVLTLGVLSIALAICAPVLGPIAWIMGYNDMKQIRAGYMDRTGEGLTQAGMIMGMVMTILSAIVLGIYCLIFTLVGLSHGFR
jgi:hypothetical protein